MIEGIDAFELPDWGLDNTSDKHVAREHACLRVQATLLTQYGLREVFAPTTSFRSFYDQLSNDALGPVGNDESVAAVRGLQRASAAPWAPHLRDALRATGQIAEQIKPFASPTSLWDKTQERITPHPTGLDGAPWLGSQTCGDCAWHFVGGRGLPVSRCRQVNEQRIDSSWPACLRWEATPMCESCGACCREGYDSVTITKRDGVTRVHPNLVVDRGNYLELARTGTRCAALEAAVAESGEGRYQCTIYADRPRPCRELEVGGPHCLTARKRVGLTI